MKNFKQIITVVALAIFMLGSFSSRANTKINFPANFIDNESPLFFLSHIEPTSDIECEFDDVDSVQVCVSIVFVTICYTYDIPEKKSQKSENIVSLLKSHNSKEFEIIGDGNSTYLIIKGFDKKLNGTVLKGDKTFLNSGSGAYTKPGNYTIKDGKIRVPIMK